MLRRDWSKGFQLLADLLNEAANSEGDQKVIMAKYKPDLLARLFGLIEALIETADDLSPVLQLLEDIELVLFDKSEQAHWPREFARRIREARKSIALSDRMKYRRFHSRPDHEPNLRPTR